MDGSGSEFFFPPFCLFRAPKYKWLFSPNNSFNFSLSNNFLRNSCSVRGLAPVPGFTCRPVRALGALRLGSSPLSSSSNLKSDVLLLKSLKSCALMLGNAAGEGIV